LDPRPPDPRYSFFACIFLRLQVYRVIVRYHLPRPSPDFVGTLPSGAGKAPVFPFSSCIFSLFSSPSLLLMLTPQDSPNTPYLGGPKLVFSDTVLAVHPHPRHYPRLIATSVSFSFKRNTEWRVVACPWTVNLFPVSGNESLHPKRIPNRTLFTVGPLCLSTHQAFSKAVKSLGV